MPVSKRTLLIALAATAFPFAVSRSQARAWSVDPKPVLVLGDANNNKILGRKSWR